MTKSFLCALLAIGLSVFAENIQSPGRINPVGVAVPETATGLEQFAAAELVSYLTRITGTEFKVVSTAEARFRIGAAFVQNAALGHDGLAIQSKAGVICIGGGTPLGRGTLYGVYEYLEQCGARFWTRSEEFIPSIPAAELPEVNVRMLPSFSSLRWIIASGITDWNGKWKLNGTCSGWWTNGQGSDFEDKWGMLYDLQPLNCHTLMFFIPPDKYEKTHPEWYALFEGKRDATRRAGQLCFTNREMIKEFIKNVRSYLKERGKPNTILAISKEDNQRFCQCPECLKVDAEEGTGHTGAYVRFLNAVAQELEKEYPDLRILASAYLTTGLPPQKTVLHKNIIVDLALAGFDLARDFSGHPVNQEFLENINGWSKASSGMFICDYGSTFDNYLYPFPNFNAMATRLRVLKKINVQGISTINAHSGKGGGEFQDLRNYLTAKLYWNCDLDPWEITREFCDGFYGKGGRHLYAYLRWYHHFLHEEKHAGFVMGHNPSHLYDAAYVAKAKEFFRKAYDESGNDPVLKKRIDYAYLSIRFLEIEILNTTSYFSPERTRAIDDFEKECARFEVSWLNEGLPLSIYLASLRLDVPTPDFCRDIPRQSWYAYLPSYYVANRWATREKEPGTPSGNPVRMTTFHEAWATYLKLDCLPGAAIGTGRYDAYACIRIESFPEAPPDTISCKFGWIDDPERQENNVKLRDTPNGKYVYVRIASDFPPTLNGQVWIAPVKNPEQIKAIFIDHFIFVKTK